MKVGTTSVPFSGVSAAWHTVHAQHAYCRYRNEFTIHGLWPRKGGDGHEWDSGAKEGRGKSTEMKCGEETQYSTAGDPRRRCWFGRS